MKIEFAKLAGIKSAVVKTLGYITPHHSRPIAQFSAHDVGNLFASFEKIIHGLRKLSPDLFEDFVLPTNAPTVKMVANPDNPNAVNYYSRDQLERLLRDIDQIFEIRANSELMMPLQSNGRGIDRVFISHGTSKEWLEVQQYLEKDIKIATLELAQQPNMGRTVLEKLYQESCNCNSAVILMSGDDIDSDGTIKARENVLHEIGFFQGKYGLNRIILMHEEDVNIPSNIHGVVYTPFTKGNISASFALLQREIHALYRE